MNCNDIRGLLDAYVDAELDLMTSLEIERHLKDCAGCAQRLQNLRTLREKLRAEPLYFKAPPQLHQRVQASLRPQPTWRETLRRGRWLSLAAALLVGVLLATALYPLWNARTQTDALTEAVLASHIRSLMVDHLTDVVSSDQHTVKPWFNGKLDFSPTVIDLAAEGFPLLGGRLDYLDNRTVTALVYGRQKHIINLFIWPSSGAPDAEPAATTQQGYHLIHWSRAGAVYWAVSDVEIGELQTFVNLVQPRLPPSGS
jgi:anti-sigma factor RsiW